MRQRPVWYLFLGDGRRLGLGECAPLAGLSLDNFSKIESMLDQICLDPETFLNSNHKLLSFPAIRFALETAWIDLHRENNKTARKFLEGRSGIKINALIWMGSKKMMLEQINIKLADGYKCLKLKIGALDFETEIDILREIRRRFNVSELEIRVDANGAFSKNDVFVKLNRLAEFNLHSIEQPISAGEWPLMQEICENSPVPIALDEELIPLQEKFQKEKLLRTLDPQFLVLKPSLLGGFSSCLQWINLARKKNIGWWVTSALESNLGLCHIAQWVSTLENNNYQGLGTGHLFKNNIPTPLILKSDVLKYNPDPAWEGANDFIKDWLNPYDSIKIKTSGSTGKSKIFDVKKQYLINSALSTGKSFHLKSGDSALLCLPLEFIAGKMMLVRSLVLGLELSVISPAGDPLIADAEFDFAALVPLQLRQSINAGNGNKVKKIIVGGGQLEKDLEKLTLKISSLVFETFGLTETLSHVAFRAVNGRQRSEYFSALENINFSLDNRGCLIIHAPHINSQDVHSNDLVELISNKTFLWLGRADNLINSGGIKIIPEKVEKKLSQKFPVNRYFIAGRPHKILGEKLILIIEGPAFEISDQIWLGLDRYEIPKEIIFLKKFKYTDSGKIKRSETLLLIPASN